ncbi:hypothetical protein MTO96_039526, partial [Rhipicephalus appendiculatus]
HKAVDEITGNQADEFRGDEEETDGCRIGEQDVSGVGVAADATSEDNARRAGVAAQERAASDADGEFEKDKKEDKK